MKTRKFFAAALAGFLLSLAPATGIGSSLAPSLGIHGPSVVYAAKGGARMPSMPKTSPKPAAPTAPKATSPDTHKSVSGNGGSYAPSKNAKDLEKNAPGASTNANAGTAANGAANTQSGSRLGSVLRGVGLLAGGMFLGSMLGSLLGFGGGFMSDILGILVNVALFLLAFTVLRALLGRFLGRKKNNAQSAYHQQNWNAARPETHAAQNGPLHTIDITPTESHSTSESVNGSDAKQIANKYRNL